MKGPCKSRFELIYKGGKRATGRYLRLISLPGEGLVGFATSKKIGGKPQRNRQRRRAREAVRQCEIPTGLDYIVVVHPEAGEAAWEDLRTDAVNLFGQMRERWASDLESS